jgi:hypothetical protein
MNGSGARAFPGPAFWLLLVALVGALVIIAFLVGRSSVTPVAVGGGDNKDGAGEVVEHPPIVAAAKELLENAVRSPGGAWTPELDEKFQTLSSRLPLKKRFELGLQLVNLLNERKLKRMDPPDDCTTVPFQCGGATDQNQSPGPKPRPKKAE